MSHISPIEHGILRGHVYNLRNDIEILTQQKIELISMVENHRARIRKLEAENAALRKKVDEISEELIDYQLSTAKLRTHVHAEQKISWALMTYIDELTKHQNIFRIEKKNFIVETVPSGKRKGKPITLKDEYYLKAFKEYYEKRYKEKYKKYISDWKSFLHSKIDY
ncbi:hypothetical protein [Jhaorihella thermophila]|uniref:Uncharacterized protein n=1 Tax=Jhaorihella thermophila TaxID=488547 RepID=A0A1H5ZPI8_9RHOB|nr:hypothetical protein [Jhaorihella thermophila]SEG37665.1 hypothetical protein SAMN05421751_1581 [Jhaorihella thermophila]